MSRRASRTETRPESWWLINVATPMEAVVPDDEKQIAELVEVPESDLTSLPFGVQSTMYMSRSKQLDDAAPVNVPASHALKLNGLALTIRGNVVVHHERAQVSVRRAA